MCVAASPSEGEVLLDDDSLESVALCLSPCDVATLGLACRRWRGVAFRDSVWETLARVRWANRRQRGTWLAAAAAGSNWRAHYAQREAEIRRKSIPIFSMATPLDRGRVFGLHLFEPRYKWLIRRAIDDHDSHFVFCTKPPAPDHASARYSWLCQALGVEILSDGRANFGALPLARCRIENLWHEPVPDLPEASELAVADITELPDHPNALKETPAAPPKRDAAFRAGRPARVADALLLELISHPQTMNDLHLSEDRLFELLMLDDDDDDDDDGLEAVVDALAD